MEQSRIIHLRGLEFYAYHGVLPQEQELGQRFIVDVDLYLYPHPSSDEENDLAPTVSYAEAYTLIEACVTTKTYKLIESLAEGIAVRLLEELKCPKVRVEVHKPQAPIAGIFRDISVEITRVKESGSVTQS